MNQTKLTPNCRVVIEGSTYTYQHSEKRGRWDYIFVADAKGKVHEFTEGKVEQVLPAIEPIKEVTVTSTPNEPKAAKAPAEPKAPRVRKDISGDPMALGFAKFRQEHPAEHDEKLGRKIQDKGDAVALQFCEELAAAGGNVWACPMVMALPDVETLKAKYSHLNAGMQRMNLGNILRAYSDPNSRRNRPKKVKAEKPEAPVTEN